MNECKCLTNKDLTKDDVECNYTYWAPICREVSHAILDQHQATPGLGSLDRLAASTFPFVLPASSHRAGLVEYRYRPGVFRFPACRDAGSGYLAPLHAHQSPQTPPGVVSGSDRQKRTWLGRSRLPTTRLGPTHHGSCLVALDPQRLAQPPTG